MTERTGNVAKLSATSDQDVAAIDELRAIYQKIRTEVARTIIGHGESPIVTPISNPAPSVGQFSAMN